MTQPESEKNEETKSIKDFLTIMPNYLLEVLAYVTREIMEAELNYRL